MEDLFNWSRAYDFFTDSKQLFAVAAGINLVSLIVILVGLIQVKRWIEDNYKGQRRWRCSVDG